MPDKSLDCDDGDPRTDNGCDDNRGGCVFSRRSSCRTTTFSEPTFTATRSGKIPGATGFTLQGRINTPFRPNSRIDPSRGIIQITLADAYGNVLVAQQIGEGKQWHFDGKSDVWRCTLDDKNAGIQRLVITKAKNKREEFEIEVHGRFANATAPDLRGLKPLAALLVTWTGDISGPCSAVVTPNVIGKTRPPSVSSCFAEAMRPGCPDSGE